MFSLIDQLSEKVDQKIQVTSEFKLALTAREMRRHRHSVNAGDSVDKACELEIWLECV